MKDATPLNAFQRRVLDEALSVVAEVDGKPFNNLDRLLLRLRTSTRPEDIKLQLKLFQEALEADYAWREEAVSLLLEFKAYWGPIFTRRRLLGQKLPEIYPDPDDVVILSPTEFRFLGPLTAEEAATWEFFISRRHVFIFYANEIIESAGLFNPLEDDHQLYLQVRSHFYRVNRRLPKAFKKKHPVKFPSFKPPAEPPAWFFEDDG